MSSMQKKVRNNSSHLKKLGFLLLVSACTVVVVLLLGADSCSVLALILPPPPPPPPSGGTTWTTAGEPAAESEFTPYEADSRWGIEWDSVSMSLSSSSSSKSNLIARARVGLLNFNSSEMARWRSTLPSADVRAVSLAPISDDVTWEALYPEWINEEDSSNSCPSVPDPALPLVEDADADYDLVAVKLPGRRENWSRDVRRLHLQLSAAKLALRSNDGGMVLILSEPELFPLPNLFSCKHLLAHHGHAWLYRPDAAYLRRRLSLPVGSCELAVPSSSISISSPRPAATRQAYATVLHSGDAYVCGAIALAQSIRRSGSTRDLVALVDAHGVGASQRAGLAAAGWQVRLAPRIRNPRAARHAYNEWNYSKFRLWQLTDYERVVFLDADLLVLRNMDWLFDEEAVSELSGTGNSGGRFNSGVMVLEPCNCTFDLLMSGIHRIDSYNGGDQGYLNEVFTWWHRLPRGANLLKHVWQQGDRERLLLPEPAAVHYLGIKPWLCYRDYDCNWDVPALRRFASDEAHARWWAVHDLIEPAELRHSFCGLPASQVAALERFRRDGHHWNRTITDPRAHFSKAHG